MKLFLVKPALSIRGTINLPADKSISHRAIIIGSISEGKTVIKNFSCGTDCDYTIQAFKKLGVQIKQRGPRLVIFGKGRYALKKPKRAIFIKDSGTTMRLLLGILAGLDFSTRLTAGGSLSRRPMKRVIEPLRMMGARIRAKIRGPRAKSEEYPPVVIKGRELKPIKYRLPLASAQVKSAILLAGLYAKGVTEVIEPTATRDHTERMLKCFGAHITRRKNVIRIKGKRKLVAPRRQVYIPGDISSASFFIVAALILGNSSLVIRSVCLNPTRLGLIRVLKRMGANITTRYSLPANQGFEPMGDIIIKSSQLRGTKIKTEEIPFLIDELPVLMVAACFTKGRTIIEGARELRVKETDRIRSMVMGLKKMGASIEAKSGKNKESIIITGTKLLIGAKVSSFNDHRTAMSLIIAGLKAKGNTRLDDVSCINKSFPAFLKTLSRIIH